MILFLNKELKFSDCNRYMISRKKLGFIILSFLFLFSLTDQGYAQDVLNNNGPSVNWQQIKTPHFRIIFPENFGDKAQEVANNFERIHDPLKFGDKAPRRIDVVLRNQNAISNGFVSLAPRRSEFYTMPSQNVNFTGTNEWLDLLTVHEYRHIAQFQHSRRGFNKLLYLLFGQATQAGMAFASVPRWFWEGDATLVETLHTRSGRGRIPEFSRVFRSNLLEGKRFNYNKQHLRSFKDFIPDHYRLGYHFAAHIRKRTRDPEVWDKITQSSWSVPFVPFTFSNGMKKHTGDYLVTSFDTMMDDWQEFYKSQQEQVEPTPYETITKRRTDVFTDYEYPQVLADGTVVVLKSGLGDPAQLVRIDENGKELKKFITGVMNNTGMLSSAGSTVVWDEYTFSGRWRAKSFSVIKSYNFATRTTRQITRQTRYAGSALSPDQQKIVTSETTEDHKNNLVILNAVSGTTVRKISDESNSFYSLPTWSPDGIYVYVLKTNDAGRSVVRVNSTTGSEEVLIGPTDENVGFMRVINNYLLFNSPVTGIDNIFAYDLETRKRFQVTDSKYGAYYPDYDASKNRLVYNEHTPNGLDVVYTSFEPESWRPVLKEVPPGANYIDDFEIEDEITLASDSTLKNYPIKNYSTLTHALNVHTWGPFASTDLTRAEFGLFSRDVLSTTQIEAGYTYDLNEETGFANAGISYQGLPIIVDFGVQYGDRRQNEGSVNDQEVEFTWKEKGMRLGLRLPVVLTNGKNTSELSFSNTVGFDEVYDFENTTFGPNRFVPINDSLAFFFRDVQNDGKLLFNDFNIRLTRLQKISQRDIFSRWGQFLNFDWLSTPYGGDFEGGSFAARGNFFFPSPLEIFKWPLTKHHSFYVGFAYQKRDNTFTPDLYMFRNLIPKPRGYRYSLDEEFTFFSLNYTLPLWYPDIALGPILNIQRFRLNGFYDYGWSSNTNYFVEYTGENRLFFSEAQNTYESIGAELIMDFNLLRFPSLISLGMRYSYLITTGETNMDFLIVNIGF